jgi:SWI/SNF-related matrix-associated actin-dependent regulator of chromatin subfamily D
LDQYLRQIFNTEKIRFADIPGRLHPLLSPPDPIAIHHKISCDPNESTRNKTTCYDIEVEIDDPLRQVQSNFLRDTAVAVT